VTKTDMDVEISRNQGSVAGAGEVAARAPVVIEPGMGRLGLDLAEIWRYRDLLAFLTWRDVKVRYKQTVLGFLWAFLQPFTTMVVFSLVFGRLMKVDSLGTAYPVFVYAGLLPWHFFAESLARSSQSVVASSNIVTKVYFPRLVIPLASVGGCLVDFAVSFLILVGLMLYYGLAPGAGMLVVIPLVAVTIIAALGVGTLLSALNVAYRDFRYVLPFIVQIWMFLTPVVYPLRAVPADWRWLAMLNPMSGIVEAYRSAILGRPFAWGDLGVSVAVSVFVFLLAVVVFKRIERRFADII